MALLVSMLALLVPSPAVAHSADGYNEKPIVRDYHARHKGCNTKKCDQRLDQKVRAKARARKWAVVKPYNAWLNATAWCESRGRWFIATGNGFYGGLQFTLQSWAAVGGRGYPHQNSILEQKFRGVKLLHVQGRGAWPVCG